MPHADSALVPSSIITKTEFWTHVHSQLQALLDDQRNWVTNLANASSLIFNSLAAFPTHFGGEANRAVNWCGFYISSAYFPSPRAARSASVENRDGSVLLLGPFCGKPACQFINVVPEKARGVCADAYIQRRTVVVQDVDAYPGHIACDGETKSEIVWPLILDDGTALGVLDLDCLASNGFDEEDKLGLERIAKLVVSACDW